MKEKQINSATDYSKVLTKQLKKEKKKYIAFTCTAIVVSMIISCFATAFVLNKFGGISNNDDPNLNKFMQVYDLIKDDWYFGEEAGESFEKDYIERALAAMANEQDTDSYLRYYPYEEPSFVPPTYGVGMSVSSYDGYVRINSVFSNSGASKAGLKAGDLIYKVGNIDVRYKSLSEVTELVKGTLNTFVEISVIRGEEKLDFSVERLNVKEDSVFGYDYDEYAVLKVTGFDEDTASKADKFLEQITKSKGNTVRNLIIDLRDNGGGYVLTFSKLADLFIEENKLLATFYYKGENNKYEQKTSSGQKYTFDKIVILVNENSASASEAFTGAMKDNLSNVTIMGLNTYGKGIAQKTVTFQDGSSLLYTYAEYKRPNGDKVHGIGIAPDVVVKDEGIHRVYNAAYEQNETYGDRILKVLNALGYNQETWEEKVSAFQVDHGLEPTGVYDYITDGKMLKLVVDTKEAARDAQLQEVVNKLLNK